MPVQCPDCNGNELPDEVEIAGHPSLDWNNDGIIDNCQQGLGISEVSDDDENSKRVVLFEVFPNPFNPQTTITFYTDRPQRIRVAVYDIRGGRIAELTNQQYQIGEHSVEWRGRDSSGRAVPSGEYFFRVDIGGQVETRKAMLLR